MPGNDGIIIAETTMEPDTNKSDPANSLTNTNKPTVNLAGRIYQNPVVSCRIEGEAGALLFNADNDSTLLINPTGILVWSFLNKPRTVEEIVEYITSSFSNSPDHASVREDIESFMTDLAPDFISEA